MGQQLAWPVERTGQAPPVQVAREEEREEHQRHVDDAAPTPGVLRYVAQAVEVGRVPGRPVFARVPVRVPAARVGLEAEHLQPPRLVAPPAAQRGRERGRVEPVRNADVDRFHALGRQLDAAALEGRQQQVQVVEIFQDVASTSARDQRAQFVPLDECERPRPRVGV